jgi:hypothetical protein
MCVLQFCFWEGLKQFERTWAAFLKELGLINSQDTSLDHE